MVAVGLTTFDPLAATVPMPWSMLTLVAFEAVQVMVVDAPAVMLAGCADAATTGAGVLGAASTLPPPHPVDIKSAKQRARDKTELCRRMAGGFSKHTLRSRCSGASCSWRMAELR